MDKLGKKKESTGKALLIEVEQGPSGSWFFRIRSANNRILCFSEMYSSHHAARRSACVMLDNMKPGTNLADRMDER
jgi:hypothetical protein